MCNNNNNNNEYKTAEEVRLTGEERRDHDIQQAKKWIREQNISMSGYNNKFKYKYYEFTDFIGYVQEACERYDLVTHFSGIDNFSEVVSRPATQRNERDNMPTMIATTKLEIKSLHYHIPRYVYVPVSFMMIHQDIGKAMGYAKRYAYILGFEIAEADLAEATNIGSNDKDKPVFKQKHDVNMGQNKGIINPPDNVPEGVGYPVDQTTLNTQKENTLDTISYEQIVLQQLNEEGKEATLENKKQYAKDLWKQQKLSPDILRTMNKRAEEGLW